MFNFRSYVIHRTKMNTSFVFGLLTREIFVEKISSLPPYQSFSVSSIVSQEIPLARKSPNEHFSVYAAHHPSSDGLNTGVFMALLNNPYPVCNGGARSRRIIVISDKLYFDKRVSPDGGIPRSLACHRQLCNESAGTFEAG